MMIHNGYGMLTFISIDKTLVHNNNTDNRAAAAAAVRKRQTCKITVTKI